MNYSSCLLQVEYAIDYPPKVHETWQAIQPTPRMLIIISANHICNYFIVTEYTRRIFQELRMVLAWMLGSVQWDGPTSPSRRQKFLYPLESSIVSRFNFIKDVMQK